MPERLTWVRVDDDIEHASLGPWDFFLWATEAGHKLHAEQCGEEIWMDSALNVEAAKISAEEQLDGWLRSIPDFEAMRVVRDHDVAVVPASVSGDGSPPWTAFVLVDRGDINEYVEVGAGDPRDAILALRDRLERGDGE